MAIANKCTEAIFRLTGEDGAESVDGFDSFKYLERLLHESDDRWLAALKKIRKVRQVWGRLGKFLQREGADPIVSEKFYRTVDQAVLLFGAYNWVPTEEIAQKLEGVHVGFLQNVTEQKTRQLGDNSWRRVAAEIVLQAAGTKPLKI